MKHPDHKNHKDYKTLKAKPIWHDILTLDLLTGLMLEVLVLLVSLLAFHIRYPKLTFSRSLLLNTMYLLLMLPFLVGFFGIAARSFAKGAWVRVLTRISLPAQLIGIIAAIILCLLPPYCSATGNPKQYLCFDKINAEMEQTLRGIFPSEIPQTAMDVNYQYYKYESVLEETLHLSLGVTMDAETFQSEADRVQALSALADAERSSDDNILIIDTIDKQGIEIHITMDRQFHRIIYSASYRIRK